MSAQLEQRASFHATLLFNWYKQIFEHVPPIPAHITLEGRTAIVTGANIGLGLECARQFLELRPSRLIMAVRSLGKGEAAAADLRTQFPGARIEVWELDMESFKSVQAFAARCERELERLHVAVLNAALGKLDFTRVEEGGRETTLQVNYLATALLGILLLPKMKPSASSPEPGRLTFVTSDSSLPVKLDDPGSCKLLDSLNRAEGFEGFQQYSISKLLITMLAAKLAETVSADEVIINSCNPGATKGTGFFQHMDSWLVKMIIGTMFIFIARAPPDGARTYVHASLVLGKESHGSYTDWIVRPWPAFMYTEQGQKMSEKLWTETKEEFGFASIDWSPYEAQGN